MRQNVCQSIRNVAHGYINLIKLIIKSFEMPGVFIVYATTPQFYDDAKRNFNYFKNDETDKFLTSLYNLMEKERLALNIITPDDLKLFAQKIVEIYILSEGLSQSSYMVYVWKTIEKTVDQIANYTTTMREFITKILPVIKNEVALLNL